jgi:ribosome-binding factor A
MANPIRLKRIADRIRDDLSELLVRQVADPRLGGVTITDVKVDREVAFADVFVSSWEGHERSEEIVNALRHAASYLRTELAGKVDLRSMPRLRFHWDPTPEQADHIEKILLELRNQDAAAAAAQPDSATPPAEDEPDDDE